MITPTQKQLIEQKAEELLPVTMVKFEEREFDINAAGRNLIITGATYFAENLAMKCHALSDYPTDKLKDVNGEIYVIGIDLSSWPYLTETVFFSQDTKDFWIPFMGQRASITHWMPLPDQPPLTDQSIV